MAFRINIPHWIDFLTWNAWNTNSYVNSLHVLSTSVSLFQTFAFFTVNNGMYTQPHTHRQLHIYKDCYCCCRCPCCNIELHIYLSLHHCCCYAVLKRIFSRCYYSCCCFWYFFLMCLLPVGAVRVITNSKPVKGVNVTVSNTNQTRHIWLCT